MKNKRFAWWGLMLGIGLMAGCIDDDQEVEPENRSGLTVVNSFIEAQAAVHRVDIGRGLQQIGAPLQYGASTFFAIPSRDDCRLEVVPVDDVAVKLADTTVTFAVNRFYSSFVFGTRSAPRYFLTDDRLPEGTENPASVAGLRFYNLANTAHRVTLHISSQEPLEAFRNRPTETGTSGRAAEQFILTTDTGTHVLSVVDEAGNQLVRRTGVALDPGDYLTVFLTGDDGENFYYIGVIRHLGVN